MIAQGVGETNALKGRKQMPVNLYKEFYEEAEKKANSRIESERNMERVGELFDVIEEIARQRDEVIYCRWNKIGHTARVDKRGQLYWEVWCLHPTCRWMIRGQLPEVRIEHTADHTEQHK
jgi:hypothetical protein